MPDDNAPNLFHASAVSRSRAQIRSKWRGYIQYGITCLALTAVFVPPKLGWTLALFACILVFVGFYLRMQANSLHLLSRDAQRLALLSDGLGRKVLTYDSVEIIKDCDLKEDWKKAFLPDKYYTSHMKPGRARLALNIAESIFFSKSLLQRHQKTLLFRMIISPIVLILLVIIILALWSDPDRYVIITGGAAVSLMWVDNLETLLKVRHAIRTYEKVDRRLDSIIETGGLEDERIFAAFADYALASGLAPPIPSGMYLDNREAINNLWEHRLEEYENIPAIEDDEGKDAELIALYFSTPRIFEDRKAFPRWLSLDDARDVLMTVLSTLPPELKKDIDSIELGHIEGASDAIITEIKLRTPKREIGQFVIKFYRSKKQAEAEHNRLKKYAGLAVDFFPRVIDDPRLLLLGGVGFYHVNIASGQEFISAKEAISHISRTGAFNTSPYKERVQTIYDCVKALARVFNNRMAEPSDEDLQKLWNKKGSQSPSELVLDLRNAEWIEDGQRIKILNSQKNNFDSSCPIYMEDVSSEKHLTLKLSNWKYHEARCITDIVDGKKLAFIITEEMVSIINGSDYLEIIIPSAILDSFPVPIEKFLAENLGGDWSRIELYDAHEKVLSKLRENQATLSLCHCDFHAGNILISNSTFRVIDFFDIGMDLVYSDVCCLQLSALMAALSSMSGNSAELIKEFVRLALRPEAEGSNNVNIAMFASWVSDLRNQYDQGRNHVSSNTEYASTLLIEAIKQAHYSICSRNTVSSSWPILINALKNYLNLDCLETDLVN